MTTALAPTATLDAKLVESALLGGDLAKLVPEQRLHYYRAVCESLGLNPLTKPFDYITLNGKLTLYARRDATDQLRKLHSVSIQRIEKDRHEDIYIVTAYAVDRTGRTDASTGAVSLTGLRGEALANALMKAETKAKRRVTLSICGLGMLDESESVEDDDVAVAQGSTLVGAFPEPPKPAQRKSEQDAGSSKASNGSQQAAAVANQKTGEMPAPAPDPKPALNVGTIEKIERRGDATFIVLNTGFEAGTKDAAFITSAEKLRDSKRVVELTVKAPSDPARFAAKLIEITPITEPAS